MKRKSRRVGGDTFATVIAAYLNSDKFKKLGAETQTGYRRHLVLAQSVLGTQSIEVIRPALVQAFLDGLSDKPGKQKVALTSLKALERWAVVRDMLPRQITTGTEAPGGDGGHVPWTDAQIELAERECEPYFARVITLAANLGQRGSDLVRMRWSDFETYEGRVGINVRQKKTDIQLWIPLPQKLVDAMEGWDREPGYLLKKPDGHPFTRPQLSDHWIKHRPAELAGCTLHGLRSTAIVRLRRAGVSTGLITSLVGLSEAMVNRYCRFAVQKDNAIAAVIQLDGTARERAKSKITNNGA